MLARNALALLVLTSMLSISAERAQADAGSAVVTPQWAGVWEVFEETHAVTSDCGESVVISSRSYLDTLCTGQDDQVIPLGDFFGQAPSYGCSGDGFTATALQLSCGGQGIYGGCPGNSTFHQTLEVNWTLSGNVATTVYTNTMTIQSGFPGCGGTRCTKKTGTRTRVSDGAAVCGPVPTRPRTWGSLKILYR
jgi:hypothetical protein